MSTRQELIAELASELEELRTFKLASKANLSRWYELARELEAKLVTKDGLSSEVPSLLWNYLADADIRFKDTEYASLQDRQMRLLVQCLKRGEIPTDEEIKEFS